jgi:hypothetical protein
MRPQATHAPARKPGEAPSDVGPRVVRAPTPPYRVSRLAQLLGRARHASRGQLASLSPEAPECLLPRVRGPRPRVGTTADRARWQPEWRAARDRGPQTLASLPDPHAPRLLRVPWHAQLAPTPKGSGSRRSRLRRGCTGHHPVIRLPREPISPASPRLLNRRPPDVTAQGRDHPAWRSPTRARQEPPCARAASLPPRRPQAQPPALGHTLGDQGEPLLVLPRPHTGLQVRVHAPRSACVPDLLPPGAPGVLARSPSPLSAVGVVAPRLAHRFPPGAPRWLAHPLIQRRDAHRATRPRLARLRELSVPSRSRLLPVRSPLGVPPIPRRIGRPRARLPALPIHASAAPLRLHPRPGQLPVLPRVPLVESCMHLRGTRGVHPVCQSPRRRAYGYCPQGTVPPLGPGSSGCLSRPTRLRRRSSPPHSGADSSVMRCSPPWRSSPAVRLLAARRAPLRLRA